MLTPFVSPPTPNNVSGFTSFISSISNNINAWQDCGTISLTAPGLYLIWLQCSYVNSNPNTGTTAVGAKIYDATNSVDLAYVNYAGGLMTSATTADNAAFGSTSLQAIVRVNTSLSVKGQMSIQNISGSPTTGTVSIRPNSGIGYCRIAD